MRLIAVLFAFSALATVAGGCSESRIAAANAALPNGEAQQSDYQVGYGLSSSGPTTDLYTELKTSWKRADRPAPAAAPVQQAGPAGTGTPSAANQQVAASGPTSAAPAPSGPPPEEPTAAAYGLSSDGPTTDVYTALFGHH